MQHPLVHLAALIDWAEIERSFSLGLYQRQERDPPGAGHNLRLLAALRLYCVRWQLALQAVIAVLIAAPTESQSVCG